MPAVPHQLYGICIKEIARICKVDLATARRWKRGATCPPQSALMLLYGDLGAFDPAWAGWRLCNGALYSPENWRATPGDVLSIQLTQAQLAAYRHETLQLRATLAALEFEEQPLPTQWEIALEG
jgi:hypothetical protein